MLKHALLGDTAAVARLATEQLANLSWRDPQYPCIMAQAQVLLGRNQEGLRWLARATERASIDYAFISVAGIRC